jgi:hypothetical protein
VRGRSTRGTDENPAGASHGDGGGSLLSRRQLARARAAALVVEVQTKRLALEQRRGTPVSKTSRAAPSVFLTSRGI